MVITVLAVPGCPHASLLVARLRAALDDPAAEVDLVLVADATGGPVMPGSPTLLLDGVDPFPVDAAPSLSCRLYPHADGTVEGAPSVAELRAVLAEQA